MRGTPSHTAGGGRLSQCLHRYPGPRAVPLFGALAPLPCQNATGPRPNAPGHTYCDPQRLPGGPPGLAALPGTEESPVNLTDLELTLWTRLLEGRRLGSGGRGGMAGNTWRCLETFLAVRTQGVAAGTEWVGASDAAPYPPSSAPTPASNQRPVGSSGEGLPGDGQKQVGESDKERVSVAPGEGPGSGRAT